MSSGSPRIYHLLAFATAIVWGTTLVSTKILLQHGLTPEEIMLYRFILAYLILWLFYPRTHYQTTLRKELIFAGMGIFGGTIYFITENTALGITLASNVALIVSSAPILTGIFAHIYLNGEKLSKRMLSGSAIAFCGVALVILNGNFILRLSPLGDILSLIAALAWALYSVLLKKADPTLPVLFITRKVFLYSLLSLIPIMLIGNKSLTLHRLAQPAVYGNLLFLGFIASSLCYFIWNVSIQKLGAVRTNNYIYFIPLVTLLTSTMVLNEPITPFAVAGGLLIITGLYLTEHSPSPSRLIRKLLR